MRFSSFVDNYQEREIKKGKLSEIWGTGAPGPLKSGPILKKNSLVIGFLTDHLDNMAVAYFLDYPARTGHQQLQSVITKADSEAQKALNVCS